MASGHARRTKQVEHMAAPTKARCIKKALANGEPSTHGANRSSKARPSISAYGSSADIVERLSESANDPERTFHLILKHVGTSAQSEL